MALTATSKEKAIYSDFNLNLPRQTDGDIERNTEIDSILNSIKNILGTKKFSRRMVPPFGANLENLLFEPIDENTARTIGREILYAIEEWEDRVIVEDLNINPLYDASQYEITLTFSVRGSLQRQPEQFKTILNKI